MNSEPRQGCRWGWRTWLRIVWRTGACLLVLVLLVLLLAPTIAVLVINGPVAGMLQADLHVADIDADLLAGSVSVEGLRVGQPPGFEGDALLEIPFLRVRLDTRSLLRAPLTVRDVRVDGLRARLVRDSNGVFNVAALMPPGEEKPSQAREPVEGPAEGAGFRLDRLVLNDWQVAFEDYAVGARPLSIGVKDLRLELTDISMDPRGGGTELPGRLEMTARLMQPAFDAGRVGVAARLGVLGADVPALNAVVRVSGLELEALGSAVPPGVAQALGGGCLDIAADVAMSESLLDVPVQIKTAGQEFSVTVRGTPKAPKVDLGALAMVVPALVGGTAGGVARNVVEAGGGLAGAAVDTSVALGKGAGRVVGNVAGGALGALKGVATGDLTAVGSGLRAVLAP